MNMKRKLFLPLFSFAMLMGLFAFAEETPSDVDVSAPKAEQTVIKEENPLINAVRTGDVKKVKELIKAGADVNGPLIDAVVYNKADTVKLLIKAGADVNEKDDEGKTALMYAYEEGHLDIVKLLIKSGADINAKDNDGETALMFASRGNTNAVRLLIEAGAEE